MKTSVRTGGAALALAVGLLLATAPARAQAQAPAAAQPTAEQVRLGVEFSEQMLGVMDLKALFAKSMTAPLGGSGGEMLRIEPKWQDFFVEAMTDEFRADHAAIVAVMGRAFARTFTADELKVGVSIFRDPAMSVVMKALAAGQPPPTALSLQPSTNQLMATPAGRSFVAKFGAQSSTLAGSKDDLVRVLMPGFFQRFGDKAMALERQRRQAEGLPQAGG
jgi:hypothetical protein